jgi:UDP-N-acetyl-D-mannosaminuronic acid dehydrogenase
MNTNQFDRDVCVVGGGGHVGLPLALAWADAGFRTVIYDTDSEKVRQIRSGRMPFREEGADALLPRVLASGRLEIEDSTTLMSRCRFILLVIGTPVDSHLNPSFAALDRVLLSCRQHLRDGQILIIRSTVYPGTSERLQTWLRAEGLDVAVTCCPERVAQGQSLREFRSLPQIVSAFDAATLAAVKDLFGRIAPEFVEMKPLEAELCKLMTNSWRYIQFAAVNQFFMLARDHDVDFERILHGCRHNYPRMAMMPGPGLTAGPCLVKDTMQLAAFSHNQFMLGHSAMLVNEGLPAYLVSLAKRRVALRDKTVGVLGMAFKAESDDPRDSLSYKLKHLLSLESHAVLCTDPYVPDPRLTPLDEVLSRAEVLFIGVPHHQYRTLSIPAERVVVDVWNCLPGAAAPAPPPRA